MRRGSAGGSGGIFDKFGAPASTMSGSLGVYPYLLVSIIAFA